MKLNPVDDVLKEMLRSLNESQKFLLTWILLDDFDSRLVNERIILVQFSKKKTFVNGKLKFQPCSQIVLTFFGLKTTPIFDVDF